MSLEGGAPGGVMCLCPYQYCNTSGYSCQQEKPPVAAGGSPLGLGHLLCALGQSAVPGGSRGRLDQALSVATKKGRRDPSSGNYDERNDECLCSLDVNWDQVSFYARREGVPKGLAPQSSRPGSRAIFPFVLVLHITTSRCHASTQVETLHQSCCDGQPARSDLVRRRHNPQITGTHIDQIARIWSARYAYSVSSRAAYAQTVLPASDTTSPHTHLLARAYAPLPDSSQAINAISHSIASVRQIVHPHTTFLGLSFVVVNMLLQSSD